MPLDQYPTGAAFGFYRPGGRRPEAQNDRVAAANAPLSTIRGWVAGTLGLPGDIEGLGRMVIPGVSNEPYLPNSEYFQGKLPMRSLQETPTGRAFTESGGVFGGAGLGTGVRAAGSGAMALGRAGERFAERVVPQIMERGGLGAELLQGLAQGSRSQVVKPKGGNWLAGNAERVTDNLKITLPYDPEVRANSVIYNDWIDKKLKSYIKNDMATPEDPLRAMAEKWAVDKPGLMAQAEARLDRLNAKTQELMEQRGVPEGDLTSHRQDVLAAERARDAVEYREALHTQGNPNEERWVPEYLEHTRRRTGFPPEGMGRSEPAKAWEQLADEAMNVVPAGTHLRGVLAGSNLEANPWLSKVPPETSVYHTGRSNELGFGHLTDELRNALNPESGLPKELLMKYADLPKKTMTDVVTRVADINAWRAAQKAEADMARANSAAVFMHKDYPGQGVAWKQLKLPEDTAGLSLEERAQTLRDATKYEGDMMQHCVGSHCPDVESGAKQVYSLRDERGRPHATIEVAPGVDPMIQRYEKLSREVQYEIREAAAVGDDSPGIIYHQTPEQLKYKNDRLHQAIVERFPEWADLKPLNKITEIKGIKNQIPEAKYLPMVQDFVRSGEWSDVGDMHHTGLRKFSDAFNSNETKMLQELGIQPHPSGLSSTEDIQSMQDMLNNRIKPEPGFAAGGYVDYDPQHTDYLADNVRQGFAGGGLVKGVRKLVEHFSQADKPVSQLSGFAEAATKSPTGELMTRVLTPEELNQLNNASVIMRRKSLATAFAPMNVVKPIDSIANQLSKFLTDEKLLNTKTKSVPATRSNANSLPEALSAFRKKYGIDPEEYDLLSSGSSPAGRYEGLRQNSDFDIINYRQWLKSKESKHGPFTWAFDDVNADSAFGYANNQINKKMPGSEILQFVGDRKFRENLDEGWEGFDSLVGNPNKKYRSTAPVYDFASSPKDIVQSIKDNPNRYDPKYKSIDDLYGISPQRQIFIPNTKDAIDAGALSPISKFSSGGYVDYLADNVRQGFAVGGMVNTETETNPYDEAKIQGMVTQLQEEMTNGY